MYMNSPIRTNLFIYLFQKTYRLTRPITHFRVLTLSYKFILFYLNYFYIFFYCATNSNSNALDSSLSIRISPAGAYYSTESQKNDVVTINTTYNLYIFMFILKWFCCLYFHSSILYLYVHTSTNDLSYLNIKFFVESVVFILMVGYILYIRVVEKRYLKCRKMNIDIHCGDFHL